MSNKKLLSLILAISMVLSFSACTACENQKDLSNSAYSNSDYSLDLSVGSEADNTFMPDESTDISFEYRSEAPDEVSSEDNSSASDEISSSGSQEKSKILTFVSLNDIHGYIERDDNGIGGLSNTAYGINTLSSFYGDSDPATETWDDIVLFANGDMFQGTAVSNMTKGEAVIEAMNAMHFDGMGVGNHEFDWGLDTVLAYWDGAKSNGEADFPLVCCNISQKSANGALLGDISSADNISSCVIVEKMGVKIGLIGAIGPCKNSILATSVADYDFADVTSSVREAALKLKALGAELISVNIHYGNASGIEQYEANSKIAYLKDESGEYLIDVIFNGHTHTAQKGQITREGAAPVCVVQASGNNSAFAFVKIEYAEGNVNILDYGYIKTSELSSNYDPSVEKVITDYVSKIEEHLPSLAVSAVNVYSKNYYNDYLGKIMVKAFNADYSICNYSCIRGTGGIKADTNITEAQLYEVIPFDDVVYFIKIKGSAFYEFYTKNKDYYFLGQGSAPSINQLKDSNNYYTVAIIDYVYTSTYFSSYRKYVDEEYDSAILLRDLLVEDIRLHGKSGVKWDASKGVMIGQVFYP